MPYQSPLGQGLDGIREAIAGYIQMSQQQKALKRQMLLDQQAQMHQTAMEGFERQRVGMEGSRLDLEAQKAKQDARTQEQKFVSGIIDDNPDAVIDQSTGKHYQDLGFGPSIRPNMSLPSTSMIGAGPVDGGLAPLQSTSQAPQDMGGFRINPTSSERLRAQLAGAQARAQEGELTRQGQMARTQAQIAQQMTSLRQSGELTRASQALTARGINISQQQLELATARAIEGAMNDQAGNDIRMYGIQSDPQRALAQVMSQLLGQSNPAGGPQVQPPVRPNLTDPFQNPGQPRPYSTPRYDLIP